MGSQGITQNLRNDDHHKRQSTRHTKLCRKLWQTLLPEEAETILCNCSCVQSLKITLTKKALQFRKSQCSYHSCTPPHMYYMLTRVTIHVLHAVLNLADAVAHKTLLEDTAKFARQTQCKMLECLNWSALSRNTSVSPKGRKPARAI